MDEPKRARSWKRWIQPRIGLKNDAPVLYRFALPKLSLVRPRTTRFYSLALSELFDHATHWLGRSTGPVAWD
jgi:hypothetical protein